MAVVVDSFGVECGEKRELHVILVAKEKLASVTCIHVCKTEPRSLLIRELHVILPQRLCSNKSLESNQTRGRWNHKLSLAV